MSSDLQTHPIGMALAQAFIDKVLHEHPEIYRRVLNELWHENPRLRYAPEQQQEKK